MRVATLEQVIDRTGKDVLDYLDRQARVPVVTRAACQGDVSLLRVTTKPATTPMPDTVVVVRSEASSNTHTLHPHGPCLWGVHTARRDGDVMLGTLTVPDESEAYLSHPEHGAMLLTPGTYRVGRQRELRDEWAMVAD